MTIACQAFAANGAYSSTRHGDAVNGPQRRIDRQRGSCTQCHEQHASFDPTAPQQNPAGLFTTNDAELCFVCHTLPSANGILNGAASWNDSGHARATMDRPGSTVRSDNKCVACHDPHGVKDTNGVIPSMLAQRESTLCFGCHDGSPAADVQRDFEKTYHHPVGSIGKHHADEKTPDAFAALPSTNRHAECADCHNAHTLGAGAAPPLPPQASNRLAGVSRVEVSNGGAAAVPNYTWRGADEPGTPNEYEVCFKCHSSFTQLRPGQSNLAVLTNPANPSFHPIQAAGKNPNIDPGSFVGTMNAQSVILCSDCHGSDDAARRGPHGSSYQYILRKPSTTTIERQAMTADDICFQCHAYRVYGDANSTAADQALSRFNAPNSAGHVFHVAGQHVPCYACHQTHGSTDTPALIARRIGAITSYLQTAQGGTCNSSCHTQQSYTVNYPR